MGTLRPSEKASRSRGERNDGEARALRRTALLLCDIVNGCTREIVAACYVLNVMKLYELYGNTQELSL